MSFYHRILQITIPSSYYSLRWNIAFDEMVHIFSSQWWSCLTSTSIAPSMKHSAWPLCRRYLGGSGTVVMYDFCSSCFCTCCKSVFLHVHKLLPSAYLSISMQSWHLPISHIVWRSSPMTRTTIQHHPICPSSTMSAWLVILQRIKLPWNPTIHELFAHWFCSGWFQNDIHFFGQCFWCEGSHWPQVHWPWGVIPFKVFSRQGYNMLNLLIHCKVRYRCSEGVLVVYNYMPESQLLAFGLQHELPESIKQNKAKTILQHLSEAWWCWKANSKLCNI